MGRTGGIAAALLLCGATAGAELDEKAAELNAKATALAKEMQALYLRLFDEPPTLSDEDVDGLVKGLEEAIELYQQSLEIQEQPAVHGAITQLARRSRNAMFEQMRRQYAARQAREAADKPKEEPPPRAETPPVPQPQPPPEEVAAQSEAAPERLLDFLEVFEESPDEKRRSLRDLRSFLLSYYGAHRRFEKLVDRCVVCNGRGRRPTNQLDDRNRRVTVPCPTCNETGFLLNDGAARKAFWLCWSPFHRADEARRAEWEQRFAEWDRDPRRIAEFLKRLSIGDIDYHGMWAEVTFVEQGFLAKIDEPAEPFKRTEKRKLVRMGGRWYFYDERHDASFFESDER